jgi:hypothetical protein
MAISRVRYPLLALALGLASLVCGVWAGLLRFGWSLPSGRANLIELHGPLMVCGFLGTVISLERAVALRRALGLPRPAGRRRPRRQLHRGTLGRAAQRDRDRALPPGHHRLRCPRPPHEERSHRGARPSEAAGWSRPVSAAVAIGRDELLAELRRLCARLPIPQPGWHPYVSHIAACRDDFEHALVLATDSPDALEVFAALVAGELEPAFDSDASLAPTAAWRRLEALPIPDGQHPYLDEILPALEALRFLLVALSRTGAA